MFKYLLDWDWYFEKVPFFPLQTNLLLAFKLLYALKNLQIYHRDETKFLSMVLVFIIGLAWCILE